MSFDNAAQQFAAAETLKWSRDALESLPESVELVNFIGDALYRCEAVAKKYPGVRLTDDMKQADALNIAVALYNSNLYTPMRTPDLKMKGIRSLRKDTGLFLNPLGVDILYFKKKCVDKESGKDTGFELGKGFLSHTEGITPQFVFVVTPFKDGAWLPAVRSKPFHVFSKRQERFLSKQAKRRRPNSHLQKLDTDIDNAAQTLQELDNEQRRGTCLDRQFDACFQELRALIGSVTNDTVLIALQHGLRQDAQEETASL